MANEYNESSPLKPSDHTPTAQGRTGAAASFTRNTDIFISGLDDMTIRHHYIRKVFAILGAQLLFTCGIVCVFTFSPDIRAYTHNTPAFYYASFGLYIFTVIALSCCGDLRRTYPWNLLFLAVLTISLSYMVGVIASAYETSSVMIALGSTVAVCFAIIVFASQTRLDFTIANGCLLVCSIVLLMFGFFCIFFHSRILQVVYGSLGALLFSMFLAVDTQLILANHRYNLYPEEYIFGALILYLDFVNIFLYLLMIFGVQR